MIASVRRFASFCIAVFLLGCATGRVSQPDIFEFHNNLWLNLHLFARAVARGMEARGDLTPEERTSWDSAVAFYRAGYANRDLLFDDGMVAISDALRAYDGETSLEGAALHPELRATLERIAPVYRRHWWPAHRNANEAWIAAVRPLVDAHGTLLQERIAAAYGVPWPENPIPVDVCVTAGPNGAYTSTVPTGTIIASTEPSIQGLASLELLFHESSHAWGRKLVDAIRTSANVRHKKVPPQLWHAVLFHTAGELTRRTLAQHGIDGYVEYAAKHDIDRQLCGEGCRERVAAAWDRHLDGEASIEEALDSLIASWPVSN